jgi:flagellar biosynthesis/type III secretory pathway protein FliH
MKFNGTVRHYGEGAMAMNQKKFDKKLNTMMNELDKMIQERDEMQEKQLCRLATEILRLCLSE